MASKCLNNSRDIGFYFKKKKTDSANGVNNQPDATPNSSDDVTNEPHVTKNCSNRVLQHHHCLQHFKMSSHQFSMQPILINMERAACS